MHIEFLVEELSAEAALSNLLPKILPDDCTYRIHPFQGKPDLLGNLRDRLRGYSHWLPDDWRIVVLVDRDADDCGELKRRLERTAESAGLRTKSVAQQGQTFTVLNRIAIEELESWFFGDSEALSRAFSRVPANLHQKAKYRNPDAITGGTCEALERVLRRAGYFRGGLAKVAVARKISQFMEPSRNRSRSFRVFRDGLHAATSALEPRIGRVDP